MRARPLFAAFVLLLGCRADATEPTPAAGCEEGFVRQGSICAPHFDACPDGQLPTFGGGCLAIGPSCAEGFASDGRGGCAPVLPKDACAAGSMAVPGDAACRPVDACGDGTFGDIPDAPGTMFVDGDASAGGDGSRDKPFRTIAEALPLAATSTIALAAGTYETNLTIDRAVTIRGRCASMVELRGAADRTSEHVLQIVEDAHIQSVSITGPYIGIGAYAGDVVLDHVRVHDTGYTGIEALSYATKTKLTVKDSLVEHVVQSGMYLAGVEATVDRTVIRDSKPKSDGKTGSGIALMPRTDSGVTHPGMLTLTRSLVANNRYGGILLSGASLTVDATVIRDTRPDDVMAVRGSSRSRSRARVRTWCSVIRI